MELYSAGHKELLAWVEDMGETVGDLSEDLDGTTDLEDETGIPERFLKDTEAISRSMTAYKILPPGGEGQVHNRHAHTDSMRIIFI